MHIFNCKIPWGYLSEKVPFLRWFCGNKIAWMEIAVLVSVWAIKGWGFAPRP
jgi:hypothetical protein